MAYDSDHVTNKLYLENHEKDVHNLKNFLQAYKCDVTMLPLGLHQESVMEIRRYDFIIIVNTETICQHIANTSYLGHILADLRNVSEIDRHRLAIVQFDYTQKYLNIPGLTSMKIDKFYFLDDMVSLLDKIHYPVRHQTSSINSQLKRSKLAGSVARTKQWLNMHSINDTDSRVRLTDADSSFLPPESFIGPEPSMMSMATGLLDDYFHVINQRADGWSDYHGRGSTMSVAVTVVGHDV